MKVIEPARRHRDVDHDQPMQHAYGCADQDCQDEAEWHGAESAQCEHEVHRAVAVLDGKWRLDAKQQHADIDANGQGDRKRSNKQL